MNRQKVFSFLCSLLLSFTTTTGNLSAAEGTWTRSEILAIADAEAKRLGYEVERMTLSFDLWQRNKFGSDIHNELLAVRNHVSDHLEFTALHDRLKRLKNIHRCWVVIYGQPGHLKDLKTEERLFVLIDADSKKLLGNFVPIFLPRNFETKPE